LLMCDKMQNTRKTN